MQPIQRMTRWGIVMVKVNLRRLRRVSKGTSPSVGEDIQAHHTHGQLREGGRTGWTALTPIKTKGLVASFAPTPCQVPYKARGERPEARGERSSDMGRNSGGWWRRGRWLCYRSPIHRFTDWKIYRIRGCSRSHIGRAPSIRPTALLTPNSWILISSSCASSRPTGPTPAPVSIVVPPWLDGLASGRPDGARRERGRPEEAAGPEASLRSVTHVLKPLRHLCPDSAPIAGGRWRRDRWLGYRPPIHRITGPPNPRQQPQPHRRAHRIGRGTSRLLHSNFFPSRPSP